MHEGVDTENKLFWCNAGKEAEDKFIAKRAIELGLDACINPIKEFDRFANDLLVTFLSDLKTVRTPLFKSFELYGIDPQFAATFNVKDGIRYKELYPNIVVIFDVKWETLSWTDKMGKVYAVEPMHETYCGFLSDIKNAIKKSGSCRIDYQRRVNDSAGNAKSSFVFDLRYLHKICRK